MSFAPDTETFAKPQALLRVPVGMASPLWGLFAGAAMTGATWWWMTRWARPQNLEAMFGATAEAESVIAPEMAVLAAPVAEAVEAVVEAAPEPLAEAATEAAREPIVEAVAITPEPPIEAAIEAAPQPVVEPIVEPLAEAAPIPPIAEALAPEIDEPFAAVEAPVEAALEATPILKPKKKTAGPSATDTPD